MSRLLYQLSYGPALVASLTLRQTLRAVKAVGRVIQFSYRGCITGARKQ